MENDDDDKIELEMDPLPSKAIPPPNVKQAIPKIAPSLVTVPGADLTAMILAAPSPEALHVIGLAMNATGSPTRIAFVALDKATQDSIRATYTAHKAKLFAERGVVPVVAPVAPPVAESAQEPDPAVYAASQLSQSALVEAARNAAPPGVIVPVAPVAQPTVAREAAREILYPLPPEVPVVAPVARVARPRAPIVGAGLMRRGEIIAGALAKGQGVLVSWRGSGKVVRATLLATLTAIGRADIMPAAKSARAYFGRAVGVLNNSGLVARKARQVAGAPWPRNVAVRWTVGSLDTNANNASLGDKLLTADLMTDDTLRFEGSSSLAARVRAEYERLAADEIHNSADMTAWLDQTLRNVHHGVSVGKHVYVPGGEAHEARELVTAIKSVWGTSWFVIGVATEDDLINGLVEGLALEVTAIANSLEAAVAEAIEAKRTNVGSRRAATMMTSLDDVRERVAGYEAMLGEAAISFIKTEIAELDGKIRPLCDDVSVRASLLEFT